MEKMLEIKDLSVKIIPGLYCIFLGLRQEQGEGVWEHRCRSAQRSEVKFQHVWGAGEACREAGGGLSSHRHEIQEFVHSWVISVNHLSSRWGRNFSETFPDDRKWARQRTCFFSGPERAAHTLHLTLLSNIHNYSDSLWIWPNGAVDAFNFLGVGRQTSRFLQTLQQKLFQHCSL